MPSAENVRWRTFYEGLQPFAIAFMALFERDRLPSRSTLSRFLAALTEAPVEALRTLFLDDLLLGPSHRQATGSLLDRAGSSWVVFDIDGTREAARQRALPQTDDLPPPHADWMTCVPLATRDASAGKWCGRAQQLLRRIASVARQLWKPGNGQYRDGTAQGQWQQSGAI